MLERGAPLAARRHHGDAVDRAGRDAQRAADAPRLDHRVHELRRADDGVDRTGVDAPRAADAAAFVDQGDAGSFHRREYARPVSRARCSCVTFPALTWTPVAR